MTKYPCDILYVESFELLADSIQQPAASLNIFQNWYHLIWIFHHSSLRQCASAGLLFTPLYFCHSEGRQGKQSNGPGSAQSERVMTDTVAWYLSCTFFPLPDLFNHFASILSCCFPVLAKCCSAAAYEPTIVSLFYSIPFLIATAPHHCPPFCSSSWLEKGCTFLQNPVHIQHS